MKKLFVIALCFGAFVAQAQKPAARPSSTSTKKHQTTQVQPTTTPKVQTTQTIVTQQVPAQGQTTVTVIDEEDPINNVIREATEAYNNHDYARAASLFEKVLAMDPDDKYSWGYVVAAKRHSRDYKGALKAAESAIKNAPDNDFKAWIYRETAETHLELRDTVKAIDALGKAINLKADDTYALDLRGHLLDERGDSQGAINDFKRMIEIDPANVNAYVYLTESYGVAKQHDLALETINKAIEITPDNADCFFARSVQYFNSKDYEKSVDDFIRCVEIDPTNNFYWSMLDPFKAKAPQLMADKLEAKARADSKNKVWKQLLDIIKPYAKNKGK